MSKKAKLRREILRKEGSLIIKMSPTDKAILAKLGARRGMSIKQYVLFGLMNQTVIDLHHIKEERESEHTGTTEEIGQEEIAEAPAVSEGNPVV